MIFNMELESFMGDARQHREEFVVKTEDFLDFDAVYAKVLEHDVEECLKLVLSYGRCKG